MTVEAELHDGRVLEFPDGTDPSVVQATVKKMLAPKIPETIGGKIGGAVADTAGTMASGILAAPIAGVAGIAGGLLPGPQGQSADWVRNTQDALTLKPLTQGGATLTDIVTKPFQWLAKGADVAGSKVAEKTGSPAAGAAVNTAIQMAPAIASQVFGGKGRAKVDEAYAESGKLQSQASIKDATLNAGREAGYVIPPEKSVLRGVAGKSALRQEATIRNQDVTNSLAKKAIGIPDDVPLSPGVLESKRAEFSKPYQEIAAIDPMAGIFLEGLKKLRSKANEYFKYADRSGDPAALETAHALSGKASGLEARLDTIAKIANKPDLIPRLREARTQIAKTYDIERALNIGNGDVDAHIIGNMVDKNPAKYTGELSTIGKFDQAFRRYTGEGSRVEAPGGNSLSPHIGLGTGGGHGYGFLTTGIPLLRPAATNILLSDFYQKPNTYAPPLGLRSVSPLFDENAPLSLAAIAASQNRK